MHKLKNKFKRLFKCVRIFRDDFFNLPCFWIRVLPVAFDAFRTGRSFNDGGRNVGFIAFVFNFNSNFYPVKAHKYNGNGYRGAYGGISCGADCDL